MRIIFLLVLFVGVGDAAAAQSGSAAARPHPELPDNCEGNSLRLDVVRNKSREAGESKVTIAIARLGSGEQSEEFNRRRLYTVRAYLTAMGLPSQRLITAEGERAQGYGRIEVYIGGELVEVLLVERRKDLPVGICDNDLEDRRRYQLWACDRRTRKAVADAEGEYLFAGGRGGCEAGKPIVKLNNAHRCALERAKLKPFRLYDCRHTFATRTAEAGVDLVTLAALLGHSRVQMVMRYAHPTEEHQFNAIKRMEAYRKAKG